MSATKAAAFDLDRMLMSTSSVCLSAKARGLRPAHRTQDAPLPHRLLTRG